MFHFPSTMLFHLVMLACFAPATSHGDAKQTECQNPLPASIRFFKGVDLSTFEFFKIEGQSVWKLNILNFTCGHGDKQTMNGKMYERPDAVKSYESKTSGSMDSSSRVIESMSDVAKSFSIGVEVSGGYGPVAASASVNYKQMQRNVADNKYRYSITENKIRSYEVNLRTPYSEFLKMDDSAVRQLKAIGAPFDEDHEPYLEFISHYGTHYFSKGVLGGVVRQEMQIESALSKSFSTKDLEVAAQLSYTGLVGNAAVKVNVGTKSAKELKQFNSDATKTTKYYGGTANVAKDDTNEWSPTVKDHPYLLAGKLSKISDLIKWDDNLKKQFMKAVDYYYFVQYKKSILYTIEEQTYIGSHLTTFKNALENGDYDSWSLKDIQKEFDPLLVPEWPKGTYALGNRVHGMTRFNVLDGSNRLCPSGFKYGWRVQDMEDEIQFSRGDGDRGINKYMTVAFCTRTKSSGNREWPAGNYCIYRKGGTCPPGSDWLQGLQFWDDEDTGNGNRLGGILPDGRFYKNTEENFCCRDDGDTDRPIALPTDDPFQLLQYNDRTCQEVQGMSVTEERVRYYNERNNGASLQEGHPTANLLGQSKQDKQIAYCKYTKA